MLVFMTKTAHFNIGLTQFSGDRPQPRGTVPLPPLAPSNCIAARNASLYTKCNNVMVGQNIIAN